MKFAEWRGARRQHSSRIVKEILPENAGIALWRGAASSPPSTLATAGENAIFGPSVMDTS
jgi:hypothetical protein